MLKLMRSRCIFGATLEDVAVGTGQLASKGTQLYYHSDHHWTSTGAYIAFLLTAKKMGLKVNKKKHKASIVKNDFKGMLASKSGFYMCRSDNIDVYLPDNNTPVSILTYVDKQEKTTSYYKSANLNKKDAYTVFTNGNHPLIKIRTSADNNKTEKNRLFALFS